MAGWKPYISTPRIMSFNYLKQLLLMVNETHRKKQFPQVLNGLTTSEVHVLSSLSWRDLGGLRGSIENFNTWKLAGTREYSKLTRDPAKDHKATIVLFQKINPLYLTGIKDIQLLYPMFITYRVQFQLF